MRAQSTSAFRTIFARILWAFLAAAIFHAALAAETWVGRPLSDFLAELRAQGTALIYSSQVVTPGLRVSREPTGSTPAERLREVLAPLQLAAQPLGAGNGFAIVRAEATATKPTEAAVDRTPLEEVTVYASLHSIEHEAQNGEAVAVSRAVLERTTGAEQDALRALQYFPGTAANNISAMAHVRGGHEDETLVLFDGMELYSPVHFKNFQGLFGVVDPDLVKSMDFFSGGFPARFGNHLSGVIDIEPRGKDSPQTLLGYSLLYARAMTGGTFDDGAGEYLAGYRNASISAVVQKIERDVGEPEFEDFLGRVRHENALGAFTAGMLRLNDDLRLSIPRRSERALARYQDVYWWGRWERDWTTALRTRLQWSQANLATVRDGTVDIPHIGNGSLNDRSDTRIETLSASFTASPWSSLAFEGGLRTDRSRASYDYGSQANYFEPFATAFSRPIAARREFRAELHNDARSAYVSARGRYAAWVAELGLRWEDYEYIAASSHLSPRLNLSYELSDRSRLRFSAGRYLQAQNLNALDTTAAVPAFFAPEIARHYIVGFDTQLSTALNLRLEAYLKDGDHLRPRYENILNPITLAPELKIDRLLVSPDRYTARGLEIFLTSARTAPLHWWTSYSWSRTFDVIAGAKTPRSWDQPHAFTAGVAYPRGRWQHSASMMWHSGWPYTPLILNSANGATLALGARNSERHRSFLSLELRTEYEWPLPLGALRGFFEVRNALNRANTCCRELTAADSADSELLIDVEEKSWLSNLVPLVGIDWRF